jgi:ferric-dicitrate binding protein FerR (iron transport regulator)
VHNNLMTGRVRAEVNPPAGMAVDFTVRSPITTASVRGTSFDFDGMELRVEEGRVRLAGGDGGGTWVSAGHGAKMDSGTGRIAGAAETARLDLTLPAPAGVAPSADDSGTVTTDMSVGFTWR